MLQKILSKFLMLKKFLDEDEKEQEKWNKSTFDKSGTFFDQCKLKKQWKISVSEICMKTANA